MTTCFILVIDAARASLYTSEKAKLLQGKETLSLVHEEEHPKSRMKKQDINTDKVGRNKNGDFVAATDPKKHEADGFVRNLAQLLEKKRVSNDYQELVIVAPEHIYGMLNKHLNPHVKALIRVDIQKDYTHLKPNELTNHLSKYL